MSVSAPLASAQLIFDGRFDGTAIVSSVAGLCPGATCIVRSATQPDKAGTIGAVAGNKVSLTTPNGLPLDIAAFRVIDGAQVIMPAQTVAAVPSIANLTVAGQVAASGGLQAIGSRVQGAKGADVVAAATLTLGTDGNYFNVTGATAVDFITTTGWQAGSMITLRLVSNPTLNHNTGSPPGTAAALFLAASGNVTTSANDMITLVYDGTLWRQVTALLAV